jgi:hypothetical protein
MRCEGGKGDICCWLWLSVLSNNINVASQLRSFLSILSSSHCLISSKHTVLALFRPDLFNYLEV